MPDLIFAQFYSGKKRRGRMDLEFLKKTNPTFLCLTTAILCHALRCWQTGLFIDKVQLIGSNSRGKQLLIRVRAENPVIG